MRRTRRARFGGKVVNYPYSVGVLLAVNAVPDTRLLLDAPQCALWRPGFVQGSHDMTSTLWDAWDSGRFQVSCTTTERITSGNREELARLLAQMAQLAQTQRWGGVFAAGFPMARISGASYEDIWRSLRPRPRTPLFAVTGGALSQDWIDGYAHALLALARGLPLARVRLRERDVAIVGYLHDRGERDHAANITELRRLLAGIGLRLVSVWPGGCGTSQLAAAAGAGTVLAFPYGREAAADLARRTGARLVSCRLPLGLKESAAWLTEVGAATGRKARAEEFAARELRRCLPRLAWAVDELFQDSRLFFSGDPFLIRPLARQLSDLGARLVGAVATAGAHHRGEPGSWNGLPLRVLAAPNQTAAQEFMSGLLRDGPIHCWIGTERASVRDGVPQHPVELGYPSTHSHALYERPYLGFAGALCLLGRIAEEIQWGLESGEPPR